MELLFVFTLGTGAILMFFAALNSLFIKKNNHWIYYSLGCGLSGSYFLLFVSSY